MLPHPPDRLQAGWMAVARRLLPDRLQAMAVAQEDQRPPVAWAQARRT